MQPERPLEANLLSSGTVKITAKGNENTGGLAKPQHAYGI
jgi:hypothetical protein